MRIAFVGNFEQHKGSKIFKEIVLHFKRRHEWYIFGVVKDPERMLGNIDEYLSGVHRYHWGGLPRLIKKKRIDLVLILSLLPETFSLTFFEVVDAECPLIVSDRGFPKYAFSEYPHFVDLSKGKEVVIQKIEVLDSPNRRSESSRQLSDYKRENFGEMKRKVELKYGAIEECLTG